MRKPFSKSMVGIFTVLSILLILSVGAWSADKYELRYASEYPDNMHVTCEYPDGRILVYENYPFTAYGLHGFDNGNVFYGTEGYMIFSRRGAFSVFLGPKNRPGPTEGKDLRGQTGYPEHMADFLSAVRQRTVTRANPEVAQHDGGYPRARASTTGPAPR